MKRLNYILTGLLLAIGPFFGAYVLSIAIYTSMPNAFGIIISILLVLTSIKVGHYIFKRVQIGGPLDLLVATQSSPELDNLEPSHHENTKRRNPDELVSLINKNEHLFMGGSIKIFGDWLGMPYRGKLRFESAQYDQERSILEISFKEGEILQIVKPRSIFEASSYFKITKADKVTLILNPGGIKSIYRYECIGKTISTELSINTNSHTFDVSSSDSAVMMYN
ncbi:MAG: hypothetical protein OEW75_00565 [Cyclobacteriaceae bacterium]|nr:hypothetical protein [Cyclobacteriaceae bacterium]